MQEIEILCFICNNETHKLSNVTNIKEKTLFNQITYLLPELAILKGDFPLYICEPCEAAIESFCSFKKICLKKYQHWKKNVTLLRGKQNGKMGGLKIIGNILEIHENEYKNVDKKLETKENCVDKDIDDLEKDLIKFGERYENFVKKDAPNEIDRNQESNTSLEQSSKSKEKYKCKICNEEFANKLEHIIFHKSEILELYVNVKTGTFNCLVCKEDYTNKPKHLQYHCSQQQNNMECRICDKKFKTYFHFSFHMKHHIGLKDLECAICFKSFTHRRKILKHIKRHHTDRKWEDLTFQCIICNKIFENKSEYFGHVQICLLNINFDCNTCGEHFTSDFNLKQHMSLHLDLKYECKCGKKYATNNDLKTHKQDCKHSELKKVKRKINDTKNEETEYQCSICKMKFFRHLDFNRHKKVHEKSRKQRSEIICDTLNSENIVFSVEDCNDSSLAEKVNKNFKCLICKKEFMKSMAKNHLMFHVGSNDNKMCTVCSRPFTKQSLLIDHMKSHLGLEGIRFEKEIVSPTSINESSRPRRKVNHKCSKCDLEFASRAQLNEHLHNHSINEFQCCICRKMFSSNKQLHTHLQEHIDFMPYKNEEKNREKKNLDKSKQVLKRSKKFQCAVCSMKFMRDVDLIRHSKIHKTDIKKSDETKKSNKNRKHKLKSGKSTSTSKKSVDIKVQNVATVLKDQNEKNSEINVTNTVNTNSENSNYFDKNNQKDNEQKAMDHDENHLQVDNNIKINDRDDNREFENTNIKNLVQNKSEIFENTQNPNETSINISPNFKHIDTKENVENPIISKVNKDGNKKKSKLCLEQNIQMRSKKSSDHAAIIRQKNKKLEVNSIENLEESILSPNSEETASLEHESKEILSQNDSSALLEQENSTTIESDKTNLNKTALLEHGNENIPSQNDNTTILNEQPIYNQTRLPEELESINSTNIESDETSFNKQALLEHENEEISSQSIERNDDSAILEEEMELIHSTNDESDETSLNKTGVNKYSDFEQSLPTKKEIDQFLRLIGPDNTDNYDGPSITIQQENRKESEKNSNQTEEEMGLSQDSKRRKLS